MEKKTYKTPCMKVVNISPAALLSASSLRMFGSEETDGLSEEYSQW